MAITTAICNRFKRDILKVLEGAAVFTNSGTAYRCVLIKSGHTGTYDASTLAAGTPGSGSPSTSNIGTDACAASGTYALGGNQVTLTVSLSGGTAVADIADLSFTGATLSADGCVIFDDTAAGKPAVAVFSFGGTVSSTNGTFTVDFPASGAATSALRIA